MSKSNSPVPSASDRADGEASANHKSLVRVNVARLIFTVSNFVLDLVQYIQDGPWS